MTNSLTKSWRSGGCHCGAVRYEVNLPDQVVALSCDCSVCSKSGFIHIIVEEGDFRLTQGEDNLGEYTFGSGIAKHWFCQTCGIKAHYRPRSHPDGISVNLRCLDAGTQLQLRFEEFDGAYPDEQVRSTHPDAANEA